MGRPSCMSPYLRDVGVIMLGTTLLEGPRSRIREMLPVRMQLVKPGSQVRAGKDELTLSSGCPGDGIGRASGD